VCSAVAALHTLSLLGSEAKNDDAKMDELTKEREK